MPILDASARTIALSCIVGPDRATVAPDTYTVHLFVGDPLGDGVELAASTEMSAPAMSRHLRVLRASGLVEAAGVDDDARLRVYRLRREPFVALQAWLDQVEAFWG